MDNIQAYDTYVESISKLTENLGVIGAFIQIIGFVIFILMIYILTQQRNNNKNIKDYQEKLDEINKIGPLLTELQKAIDRIDSKTLRIEQLIREKADIINITLTNYLSDVLSERTKLKEQLDIFNSQIRSSTANMLDMKNEEGKTQQQLDEQRRDLTIDYIQLIFDFQEFVSKVKENEDMYKLFKPNIESLQKKIQDYIYDYGLKDFNKFLNENYSQRTIDVIKEYIDLIDIDESGKIDIAKEGKKE